MKLNNFTYSKQMPHWFYRVPHTRFGYRYHPAMDACMCTKSLFQLHNQTMNIYTHLLPAVYFAIQLWQIIRGTGDYADFTLLSVRLTQLLAAISVFWCMVSSSIYHTYQCLGRESYTKLLRMDYIGISIMTLGQSFCIAYTGFHGRTETRAAMAALIVVLFISNLAFQLNPCYMKKSYALKVNFVHFFFILFGMSLIFYLSSTADDVLSDAYTSMCMGVGFILVGLFFFIGHTPERYLTSLFGKSKSSRWIRELV